MSLNFHSRRDFFHLLALAQLEKELNQISSSTTKKHPHVLSRAESPIRYYGLGKSYRCDICSTSSSATVYHCETCGNYDNCPSCFWKYQDFRHPHTLTYHHRSSYLTGAFMCDICGAKGTGGVYHCDKCGNYDNCKDCYQAYQQVSVGNGAIPNITSNCMVNESHITRLFKSRWVKYESGTPKISSVIILDVPDGIKSQYKRKLSELQLEGHSTNETLLFHGTKMNCLKANCFSSSCNVCEIKRNGFLLSKAQSNINFARFGRGIYFAPHSSKANDYTSGSTRAVVTCKVIMGHSRILTEDQTHYEDQDDIAPQHSVYAKEGTRLNYPECVVYEESQVMPVAVVLYSIE